jgi:hypothetical protein
MLGPGSTYDPLAIGSSLGDQLCPTAVFLFNGKSSPPMQTPPITLDTRGGVRRRSVVRVALPPISTGWRPRRESLRS